MATLFRLATVEQRGARRAALLVDDTWVDIATAAQARGGPAIGPAGLDLLGILQGWDTWLPWLRELADRVSAEAPASAERLDPDPATLRLPFMPRQIYAAGANYYDHAVEMGGQRPDKSKQEPYFFYKNLSSVIGPNEPIVIPPEVTQPDWEAELAAVIGRPARRVSADRALDYVAGYTIMNDVSCRNLGRRTDQPWPFDWLLAKGWETFAPFGPWLVPAEFIPDPQHLDIRLWVNDELKQNTNTSDMIHTTAEQIAWISRVARLMPGDVISTGTGAGVGRPRGTFLKPGDRVTIEIERVGRLENPVVGEG
ncbi:MAG TPA: fumarylacetoacetate hydrolase family protein [Chloroflexota bacterium]|nr:fumarylacetoacetate hydrolase family protein [Chloroflexota bacterium]